jgi:hypothetical protein
MRENRKKLEDFSISRKEFRIYWFAIEPYSECVCRKHKSYKPFWWLYYGKRRKGKLRPYHNKADKCRYGNDHKS